MDHWCLERQQELAKLAQEKIPVLVYNEEVLNEVLFDLLSVQAVERIFQRLEGVHEPEVLRKVYAMGAGFRVSSAAEVDRLRSLFPELDPHLLLFAPSGDRGKDYAYALDTGMQAVVSIGALKSRVDRFAKHPVLLRVTLKGDVPIPQQLEPSFSATLDGIYLEVEGRDFVSLKDILPCLRELVSVVPKPLIVCLGDGMGLPMDTQKDSLSPAILAQQIEELMDAYSGLRIWVEPGRHLVSHAGILLTKTTETEDQNLPLDLVDGSYHAVYHLARPHEGAQVLPFEVAKKGLGGILSGVERDDILVVTNVGGLGLQAGWNREALQTHYLKARRICQVRL
jgi:diaminopimelate decarboxylase